MTTYTISSTDGLLQIPINPGVVDGPSGRSLIQSTDLILYGQGSFNWGQGVEQNLLRIMESFASPALNPNDAAAQQVPNPEPYASALDLYGIKNPVVGQTWFNKSNQRLYVCTAVRSGGNEPTWSLDAEGRYLPIGGGTITGNLDITRPSGEGDAVFRMRTNDNTNDIRIELIDTVSKAEFVVEQDEDNDPSTNIDVLKIIKKNNTIIINEIAVRDGYIETHGTNGKIRTPATVAGDNANVVTTKGYVDAAVFTGGSISDSLTVEAANAMIRAKSDSETTNPKFILGDAGGNKVRMELDQLGGNVDDFVIAKGVYNGANETGTDQNVIRMTDNSVDFNRDLSVVNDNASISIQSTSATSPTAFYILDDQAVKAELSILPQTTSGGVDDLVLLKRSGLSTILNEMRMSDTLTSFSRNVSVKSATPLLTIEATSPTAPVLLYFADDQDVKGELAILPQGGNVDDFVMLKRANSTTILNELRLTDDVTQTIKTLQASNDNPTVQAHHETSGKKLAINAGDTEGTLTYGSGSGGSALGAESWIRFGDDSIILGSSTTMNADIDFDTDDDFTVATKKYVDQRVRWNWGSTGSPNTVVPRIRVTKDDTKWREAPNFDDVDASGNAWPEWNNTIDVALNSGASEHKHTYSSDNNGVIDKYWFNMHLSFGYAIQFNTLGDDDTGNFGFADMKCQYSWRNSSNTWSAFTEIELQSLPINVSQWDGTRIICGQYVSQDRFVVDATADRFRFQLGTYVNTFPKFGAIQQSQSSGDFESRFEGMLIDDLRIHVDV